MSTELSPLEALKAKLLERFRTQVGGDGPLFVPVEDSSEQRLDLPEQGWPLPGLVDLGDFLGLPEWHGQLPAELSRFEGLSLTRLGIDEPAGAVTLAVKWKAGLFPLIPGVLELREPGLSVTVDGFPEIDSAFVSLLGRVSLGEVELAMAVELPGLAVSAQLTKPCPLTPLLEHFGLDGAAFAKMQIDTLLLSAIPQEKLISFSLGLDEIWNPGGGFKLDQVQIGLTSFLGEQRATAGRLAASGKLAGMDLELVGEHVGPGLGWQLSASAAHEKPIAVGDLLGKLLVEVGEGGAATRMPIVPGALASPELKNLEFFYETQSQNLSFHGEVEIVVTASTHLHLVTGATLTRQPDGSRETQFVGQLTVANLKFDVLFNRDASSSVLLALYRNTGGGELSLKRLIGAVSADAADALGNADLSFKLKDVLLVYEPASRSDPDSKSKYIFALDMDAGLDLSGLGQLPLIGKFLPADQALQMAFQPILVSKAPPSGTVRELLPDGTPHLPDELVAGFSFVTTLRIGDLTRTLSFGAKAKGSQLAPQPGATLEKLQQEGQAPHAELGSPKPPAVGDPPLDPAGGLATNLKDVTWIDLQKHLGPLHLQRVGIGYNDGKIDALLDASLAVGPITVALNGLGACYDLGTRELAFALSGLGIDFQRGPLEMGGAFLQLGKDFAGKINIRTEEFSLGALGAYGQHDGHPSMFLYAFRDQPMGGPAFFHVEGLAFGFGLNRRLTMPAINAVHTFPLVADAMSGSAADPSLTTGTLDDSAVKGLTSELARLKSFITPQVGEYFLAIGVKFNSFKQVDSFALLALSFGKHFELDLVGMSTLKVPSAPAEGEPVAQVQLELLARFVPEEGFLGVQAQLTPQSYVLSKSCHLQGGFAFFNWFSGQHAGDFVISVGGYHPDFKLPAHYPKVPRIGFNWQVNPCTHIKARGYFALTPSAMMAGGALEATWESGSVRAWFTVGADFLIEWKPFHYQAAVHIDLGAEVTIHFFGTHHISIDAGADLEIWGPEFSGTACVHVSIVSFSVGFGNASRERPFLKWDEFAKSFLPAADKVCHVAATHGLVRSLKDGDGNERWVVNPKEMCLAIDSAVPSSGAANLDVNQAEVSQLTIKATGQLLDNHCEITVSAVGDPSAERHFTFLRTTKNVPTALWTPAGGVRSETTLALTGYTMHRATPVKSGASHWIKDRNLQYDVRTRAVPADGRRLRYTDPELAGFSSGCLKAPSADLLKSLGFEPAADVRLSDSLPAVFSWPPAVATLLSDDRRAGQS